MIGRRFNRVPPLDDLSCVELSAWGGYLVVLLGRLLVKLGKGFLFRTGVPFLTKSSF